MIWHSLSHSLSCRLIQDLSINPHFEGLNNGTNSAQMLNMHHH